jgi:hypothetical protein
MSHLHSKFPHSWNGIETNKISIADLWQSVYPETKKNFLFKVMDSIKSEGLCFPILIVPATYSELYAQKKRFKNRMKDLPPEYDGIAYIVWGGSNRVEAARELGYTSIDCSVLEEGAFDEAKKLQREHRKAYPNIHSTLNS